MRKLKAIITILILVLSVCTGSGLAQTRFTRPTFKAKLRSNTPIWRRKIFEDGKYIFVVGDSASKNCGASANKMCDIGFFIYEKKQNKWLEVKKLSTENAKLGHSPKLFEISIAVSWDYKSLKKVDYADVDLQTTASNNYPDKIEYDTTNQAYCLKYNSSFNREDALTVFWILKEEIIKKFG